MLIWLSYLYEIRRIFIKKYNGKALAYSNQAFIKNVFFLRGVSTA